MHFSLYKCLFFPCSTEISDDKADASKYPVNDHGYPDTKDADSHEFSDNITESDSENPHGKNGNHHTGSGITAGSKC